MTRRKMGKNKDSYLYLPGGLGHVVARQIFLFSLNDYGRLSARARAKVISKLFY